MWEKKLTDITPVRDLDKLPYYGHMFFFKNMGPFRRPFYLLTLCSVASTLLRFTTVYLLGSIISNLASLSMGRMLGFYLPIWLGATLLAEGLDYLTRKYAEALPVVYREYVSLRFYLTFLELDSRKIFNFSKERLNALAGKYLNNIQAFLGEWTWGIPRKFTSLVLVLTILAVQSPVVLGVNLLYMALFLAVSLNISARFSPIAKRFAEQELDSGTVLSSLSLNLNTVKRLGLREFFIKIARELLSLNWARLEDVRAFHAKRWLLQLNLFNAIYIGTIIYGIYQIKIGALALGYLVLIKWAFDELLSILIYVIEKYVALIQQKEDTEIIRREFSELLPDPHSPPAARFEFSGWQRIELSDIYISFLPQSDGSRPVEIRVPKLEISSGEKIGIIGESGSGKTTILNILLNLLSFQGSYRIDGLDAAGMEFDTGHITIITNSDPLFKIPLRDNILLGREAGAKDLELVLKGVGADDFAMNLDAKVGAVEFNLSSGQEQRIRLARGLLQASNFYLLDEPFNGIDPKRKVRIIAFLKEHLRDKTVVLVTHNAEELALVDKVYEMQQGVLRAR